MTPIWLCVAYQLDGRRRELQAVNISTRRGTHRDCAIDREHKQAYRVFPVTRADMAAIVLEHPDVFPSVQGDWFFDKFSPRHMKQVDIWESPS